MCVDLHVPTPISLIPLEKSSFRMEVFTFSVFTLGSVWANRERAVSESLVFYRDKNPFEAAVAVSVAERRSDIPEYLAQKQESDYTLSPLIATEKRSKETESLSLLVFESHENVISKIFGSSVIQDGFSKAFVTVSSSLSIPNTKGILCAFLPFSFFLIPSKFCGTLQKCFGERGSSGLAAFAALGSSQAFLYP